MTLIAYTSFRGIPVLIGDLIVSSNNRKDNFEIPTYITGTNHIFNNNELSKPTSLRQKLYVISDNLAVALGGRLDKMYSFLLSLKTYFANQTPSKTDIDIFLNSIEQHKLNNLIAFIVQFEIQSDDIVIHSYSIGDCIVDNNEVFGQVAAAGTGAPMFIERMKQFSNYTFENLLGIENPEKDALTKNFMIITQLMGLESLDSKSLIEKWGAGFEIISFSGGKFQKLNNFLYMIWRGKISNENKLEMEPCLMMRYMYHNEVLIIRSTDFRNGDKGFGVLPIDKSVEQIDKNNIPKPEYDSIVICNFFFIQIDGEGNTFTPCLFLERNDNSDMVLTTDEEGRFMVLIATKYVKLIEGIIEQIKQTEEYKNRGKAKDS